MSKNNDSELISVGSFENIPDAYIAMGALRNEGIECQVVDTDSSLYSPFPAPIGGPRLLIFKRDLPRVKEILNGIS
ncbi:MAG: DUF2007 domain-containing protein [Muribaculaceae bacterium]|nr:DUF2007 domain-containing protein [Muribaculaceae bacterium]